MYPQHFFGSPDFHQQLESQSQFPVSLPAGCVDFNLQPYTLSGHLRTVRFLVGHHVQQPNPILVPDGARPLLLRQGCNHR